ncbi:xanthine dehydrogenase family protein subunit M [Acidobacteria bacterium AB60]|nr:xanthine dehydrogenase family protein subunit M [Acidobacteria bacterium AB60]
MKPFHFMRPANIPAAMAALQDSPNARLLGGGTNLVDLMRLGIEQPNRLVQIHALPLAQIESMPDGGVRIGAAISNTEMANHPLIRERYPLLSKALLSGASPQLRNMATAGGNLMQRTRCYYFMDTAFPACNKRNPGSGCAALEGVNRIHAIFGASNSCIAVHPSDMCVALAALDAVIQVRGPKESRAIPINDFHRLPGDTPHIETNLAPDEIITSIDLPRSRWARRVEYVKLRDRHSFAFALVSCAAALDLDGKIVRAARLAFGGVAHKPWRSFAAEQLLVGKPLNIDLIERASDLVVEGAKPRPGNRFKLALMKNIAKRSLMSAGGMA